MKVILRSNVGVSHRITWSRQPLTDIMPIPEINLGACDGGMVYLWGNNGDASYVTLFFSHDTMARVAEQFFGYSDELCEKTPHIIARYSGDDDLTKWSGWFRENMAEDVTIVHSPLRGRLRIVFSTYDDYIIAKTWAGYG